MSSSSSSVKTKTKQYQRQRPAKRRKVPRPRERVKRKLKKPTQLRYEEISSHSGTDSNDEAANQRVGEEDSADETAQEKKLRLAKGYIAELRAEEEKNADDEWSETDLVAERLKDEVLELKGLLQRPVADSLFEPDASEIRMLRGHKLPVTCVVISPDDKCIFSGSKDGTIIKWDIQTGQKLVKILGGRKGPMDTNVGHTACILCMDVSSDGKYLATGDANNFIVIWDAAPCLHLYTFGGHKGPVSGLSFRKGTYTLYTASHDRSVKVWDVERRVYVESLFGHQDSITALDSLGNECCVTAGGRDRSVRVWKIIDESQLVFHGHEGSIDCVQLINQEHMISGGDDGALALWSVMKKKPLCLMEAAHGYPGEGLVGLCRWVVSVAALPSSDTVASGSQSSLKLWKCGPRNRSLELLFSIPVSGFVNSLKFASSGMFLVAGVGQEHRLGRWWKMKEAKNGICIIPLRRKREDPDGSTDVTE